MMDVEKQNSITLNNQAPNNVGFGYNYANFAVIVSTCMTCMTAIYYYTNYIYRIECEAFYNIPAEYFSYDILIPVASSIVLIFSFLCPAFLKFECKNNVYSYIYAQFMTIIITIVYAIFLMKNVCRLLSYILIFVICFILFLGAAQYLISFTKTVHNFFVILYVLRCGLCLIACVIALLDIWRKDFPSRKIKYEFFQYNSRDYVVLSKIGDKILASEWYNNNEDIMFDTSNYIILCSENIQYYYIKLKKIPIIKY